MCNIGPFVSHHQGMEILSPSCLHRTTSGFLRCSLQDRELSCRAVVHGLHGPDVMTPADHTYMHAWLQWGVEATGRKKRDTPSQTSSAECFDGTRRPALLACPWRAPW